MLISLVNRIRLALLGAFLGAFFGMGWSWGSPAQQVGFRTEIGFGEPPSVVQMMWAFAGGGALAGAFLGFVGGAAVPRPRRRAAAVEPKGENANDFEWSPGDAVLGICVGFLVCLVLTGAGWFTPGIALAVITVGAMAMGLPGRISSRRLRRSGETKAAPRTAGIGPR